MVIKSKVTTKKKTKGPKGKKARAKAKLDRQWGEVNMQEDAGTTKRVGKSRLLGTKRQERNQQQHNIQEEENTNFRPYHHQVDHHLGINNGLTASHRSTTQTENRRRRRDNDSDDSVSTSESSQEDMDTVDHEETAGDNPMNQLLTMIQRSKNKKKVENKMSSSRKNRIEDLQDDDEINNAENESEAESEEDDESINEEDEDYDDDDEVVDNGIDDLLDDESVQNLDSTIKVDFFRQRFSRQPFLKSELEKSEASSNGGSMKKIQITRVLELQASTPSWNTSPEVAKLMDVQGGNHWQSASLEALSANRVVLQRQWKRLHRKKTEGSDHATGMTDDQASIYSFLSRYCDAFVTTDNNSEISGEKYVKTMHQIYLLHILNHVLTSRSRIARNNRLLKDATDNAESAGQDDDNIDPDKVRDQGFTRPTVLVLLPTRGVCHRFVRDLLRLVGAELDEEQEERFEADYGIIVDDNDNAGETKTEKKDAEKERRRKAVLEKKGKEWNELFGDNANQDDDFKMGVSLTPKAAMKGKKVGNTTKHSNVSVKVYSDFFKSDIIVASPLGLKMLIAPDEDEGKERSDFDYLSSIEICLLAYADVMLMQNWDHVNGVLALLNQAPRNNNNTDFSRVRNYMLEGQGAHWRQLIVSSRFMDPYLISTFKRFGKSLCGSIRARHKTPNEDAAITNVLLPIKQVFQKVPVSSLAQQGTARVDFFLKTILPQILEHNQKYTLVYIPSYFDFCSLRNGLLKRDDVPFVSVTEYSRTSEIGRGRARFLQGRKPIMLYTGRAHYFYRHAIKGVRNLIFLGIPEHPNFYSEHVNLIGNKSVSNDYNNDDDDDDTDYVLGGASTANKSCLVLFTKYEAHALERVVGSANCNRMVNSLKETFLFYS